MKVDRIIHNTLSLLAGGLLTVSLTGCLDDNSACIEDQPGYKEGNDVWLTFNLKNEIDVMGRSTRADDAAGHPDENSTAAENYIDTQDVRLLLLDDQGRLMKMFVPGDFTVISSESSTDFRTYELKMPINREYFSYADEDVTFSLLVIANSKGIGNNQAYDEINDMTYYMNNLSLLSSKRLGFAYNGFSDAQTAWTPDITSKRHIPMSGKRTFHLTRTQIENANNADSPIDLTIDEPLDMQRAMAKIRVIDAIPETDGAKIKSVTLTGMNNRGAYLPDVVRNTEWTDKTSVCEFGIADLNWFTNDVISAYQFKHNDKNSWGFYIPEFSWNYSNVDNEPVLNFMVQSADGSEKEYHYPVKNSLGDLDMARNHIYEFEVVEVAGVDATLTLNVKDWDDLETIWDYTDNPGLATGGAIKFDENTCTVETKEAQVVFRNDRADIKAEFTLASPVNATWHAVFIHESGLQGAFVFVDDKGNEVETVGGTIDGKTPAKLVIRTKDNPLEVNNVKRLQIVVTMIDGRTVTADVLKGGGYGSGKSYITIIQNHQIQ